MARQPFDTGQRPNQSTDHQQQPPPPPQLPPPFTTTSSSTSHNSNNIEEENNLTAALVKALVQTRDSTLIQNSTSTSNNSNSNSSLVPSFDFRGLLQRGEGEVEVEDHREGEEEVINSNTMTMEEEAQEEGVNSRSVTTRSGRRTRPTASSSSSSSVVGRRNSTTISSGIRVRWSSQEDLELIKLIKEEPPLTWQQMGDRLGRPGAGCAMRWYNFIRQSVGKTLADELSNKIRGTRTTTNASSSDQPSLTPPPPPPPPEKKKQKKTTTTKESVDRSDNSIQPSSQMQVGSSRNQQQQQQQEPVQEDIPIIQEEKEEEEEAVFHLPTPPPQQQQPRPDRKFPGGYPTTGELVPLQTIPNELLPPPLPPHPNKPGHPFPRPLTAHSNSGPNFLPDQALVSNPPIPFIKNTVIRGRRTHDVKTLEKLLEFEKQKEKEEKEKAMKLQKEQELLAKIQQQEQQVEPEESEESILGYKTRKSKGKTRKVHPCPAVNCGAAFKRSEHLKRHFKSVHRGEKPFPCKIESCGKSFSRKDNLQQHQAMVHGVRALYTYSDGTVSVNPPDVGGIDDDEPVSISYEAVDITKTARGAARHARQEAKAKRQEEKQKLASSSSNRKKRARTSSSTLSQSREPNSEEEGMEEDREGDGEEEDQEEGEGEGEEDYFPDLLQGRSLKALNTTRPTRQLTKFNTTNTTPRTPSTVQDLMSNSSAANQSFSIGPSSASNYNNGARGDYDRRSISTESNERVGGGGGNVIVGEKRNRENSESGGGTIDKRLRLTGDITQADELDPALRVLADAPNTIITTTGITSSSSIAPNSSGLSPLIQHALEQRIVQQQPSRGGGDIPVNPTVPPYPIPEMLQPTTSRPFTTTTMPFAMPPPTPSTSSSNLASNLPLSTIRTEDYKVEGTE
ncbi:hypothetical protein JCM3765_006174 [Sporobolomyces pararoseus]